MRKYELYTHGDHKLIFSHEGFKKVREKMDSIRANSYIVYDGEKVVAKKYGRIRLMNHTIRCIEREAVITLRFYSCSIKTKDYAYTCVVQAKTMSDAERLMLDNAEDRGLDLTADQLIVKRVNNKGFEPSVLFSRLQKFK